MKDRAMKIERIERIGADIGAAAKKPACEAWGTREYEESLAIRYPYASQSAINSLIAVTRRLAEKEKQNGKQ